MKRGNTFLIIVLLHVYVFFWQPTFLRERFIYLRNVSWVYVNWNKHTCQNQVRTQAHSPDTALLDSRWIKHELALNDS